MVEVRDRLRNEFDRFKPDARFEKEIKKQVLIAVQEANAIIFIVDAATGITDLDEAMADVLRRSSKPVFLAVNKVDNHERLLEATEFYGLGFDHIFFMDVIGQILNHCCKIFERLIKFSKALVSGFFKVF